MKKLIDKLERERRLSFDEWKSIIVEFRKEKDKALPLFDNDSILSYASEKARKIRLANFGNKIYVQGHIELTNYS